MKKERAEQLIQYAQEVLKKHEFKVTPRMYKNQQAKIAGAKSMLEYEDYLDAAGRAYQVVGTILRASSRGGR